VQEYKPELCNWLEANFLSSLTEDGFAQAVIYIPNMSFIQPFASLVLARNCSSTTLASLLAPLHRNASERSFAAPSLSVLKSARRNFSACSNPNAEGGFSLNEDQTYLKACCIVIALAQFDIFRFSLPFDHFEPSLRFCCRR
jgi:hypothetical protein